MVTDLAAITKGDFSTPGLGSWGLGCSWGRRWAYSIARPWVPISSRLTRMVYLLPFSSYLAGTKSVSVRPSARPPARPYVRPHVRPGHDDKYRSRSYAPCRAAKTVRYRPYNRNPWAGYRMGQSPSQLAPSPPPQTPNRGGGAEKSPFQMSANTANRLEVDENVHRTHFRIHWLVVK